ncbi:uncharacterized protein RJT20DRAFT_54710 [Scheffersomyces xylosifermentans]|uniref:uncharacterized protein n=1 Tax=Scheffersomyces xylosifermentans TaxID=1304137 RepID=UPI00315DCC13
MLSIAVEVIQRADNYLTATLQSNSFTANLIHTPTSKFITEFLVITFVLLVSYEVIYSSGIYLGLWEYHAKDIFTEVPIHCAHVYVRLNIVPKENVGKTKEYYALKKKSKYNVLYWNKLNQLGDELFSLDRFVKYHFEFSPEDFEMNKEPEFGSTIEHLREKIIKLFNDSDIYKQYHDKNLDKTNVLIYNNQNDEVTPKDDGQYLSKCHVETGNVIDCVVVY